MSADRLEKVLDANDNCLTRYGVRRTMGDIATTTGVSRSAVHQYVRSKDDAFRQPAGHLHDRVRSHKNAYIYLYGA
ncbi:MULTISPECIES: TetR/AcrR family transcriptional regulator [unclassified Streptomyces]|uniref:TetR/AcrR family transcriptional regulator n=1 Tax=unclassified Streptomyces TaxID=2593676 RepID=UPI0033B77281